MVFLDYRMPQMNGIETLTEMKRLYPEKFEHTPIISLTASAVSGDKEKMLKAGFTDYLSKPVNIDEMERMMVQYLPADSLVMTGEAPEEDADELSKLPPVIFDCPQLDPEKGIEYCGDADDYLFALETYEMSIDSKAEALEADLAAGDLEAFSLKAHSLKSTSGAIGATEIFEKAKKLEEEGKDGDLAAVTRDCPQLLEKYRELKEILRKILDSCEESEVHSTTPLAVVEEERSRMLSRALAEAERANMAKTAFLSNMSHEIRTPMNAIIGLYNIALKKKNLDGDTREILTKIGASAKHLLSLINDILDISRIESGHSKLKSEEFSFSSMIEQINTMTESQCFDKGLDFKCSVRGHIDDYYVGDDMKLRQMIINILGNAVKYTPAPGKVTFIVEEVERSDQKATIKFIVRDTGIGIDKDYLPKLFDPFSQEQEGSSNQYGSTGLGMAITKNIVDMMCGKIEVSSEKGKGSEFVITVPLLLSEKDQEKTAFHPENIRALIVDDDPTACEHAKMVLDRIGIQADSALSGREALVLIEKQKSLLEPYRIILTDWKMPEMDGIELSREIRNSQGEEEVTIILTTYNWDDIVERALDAGVDAFLAKPLFAGNIRQEIAEILSENPGKSRIPVKKAELSGRRVLLAEDMEINAQIMQQILKMKDIEVDLASDGKEAVKLFKKSLEGTYDAILMDIRMPEMGGLEAVKLIRAMNRKDAGEIPVIALTANAFDEDVQLSLDAGMNAHLSKPVEPDALFITLEKLIRNKES
ncbi:MAG: response regulator [Lachnospiraceae bacterium]|nr:response regulator [Lachnospiraceae bacterium]